jgi:hypothetical protein
MCRAVMCCQNFYGLPRFGIWPTSLQKSRPPLKVKVKLPAPCLQHQFKCYIQEREFSTKKYVENVSYRKPVYTFVS